MKHIGIWTSLILSAAVAAPAWAGPEKNHDETTNVVVNEDGKNIEITIHGDDVIAKVDGLKISPDHVHREGNRVILLGEDGKPIESIVIMTPPDVPNPPGFDAGGAADSMSVQAERPPVMLGVLLDAPDEALRAQLGVSEHAALIEKVMDGLPASKAGLEPWDIVVEINGEPLDEPGELHKILMESKPGDVLKLVVLRHAERQKLNITLEAYDAEALGQQEVESSDWSTGPSGSYDLQDLMQQLDKQRGNANSPEARRRIEEALRGLFSGNGRFPGRLWTFDARGRLVRPDNQDNSWRDDMADEFEQRIDDLEEQFNDRLEQLEDRWNDMEEMFDRLLNRLDEAINDRENEEHDDD